MIKLFASRVKEMVRIKNLCLIILIVTSVEGVSAASGYTQTPGSNHLQHRQASGQNTNFVDAEVLVKFKSNLPMQAQRDIAENLGGQAFTPVGRNLRVARIKLQKGSDVIAAVQAYQADANVENAQPNYIYQASVIPNDARYGQLWGMKNSGQTISNEAYSTNNPPGIAGSDIDAELAWDHITDCRSVVVAVLDTGINYTHEDLAANMWDGSASGFPNHGFDYIDNNDDPMPTGGAEDHGTHVAGTIGSVGDNILGVAGVCWQASIMSVRVLGADGSGTTASVISGINFAADNGAQVINMSLSFTGPLDTLTNDAITYAQSNDVVVVAAAGNSASNNDGGGSIVQPCALSQDNIICVAALDQAYVLASFSNYGATSVDVGAPGTNTLSSWAGQIITDDFSSLWTLLDGWARFDNCIGFITLSNPADWCTGGQYIDGIDARAYKEFDLSGTSAAELSYFAKYDTQLGSDIFSTTIDSSGGDPFAGGGTNLQMDSGSTFGFYFYFSYDISACNTSTCSIGFQLTSDASGVDNGVGVDSFTIGTLQPNSTAYHVINGTSMASPHVAGIATMVRAFNPGYTYAQTVDAVINGGEVLAGLSGLTTSGRSANAMGSIAYITEPTGIVGVVQ